MVVRHRRRHHTTFGAGRWPALALFTVLELGDGDGDIE